MDTRKHNLHFSGICGAGMGNVALLLREAGHLVKGSDSGAFPPMSTMLAEAGIIVDDYSADSLKTHFTPDIQVISNALSREHPEVLAGQALGLELLSFPQALHRFILQDRPVITVAGTHGKTSTTALLARMISGLNAGWLVGGSMQDNSPSCKLGGVSAPFVIEGDEYGSAFFDPGSKFMHYNTSTLILTHLEWDHVDIFPKPELMFQAFENLLRDVEKRNGNVIACADAPRVLELCKGTKNLLTYGFSKNADYQLINTSSNFTEARLTILEPDGKKYEISTPLKGRIYHLNLLGAWVAARQAGLPIENLRKALADYHGVRRRLELLREQPFALYSDFAHHPTAIGETLRMVREMHSDRNIWAIFDPRNASSRRSVFYKDFVTAFKDADRVILGPPHLDLKLNAEEKLDVQALAKDIGDKAIACTSKEELRAVFNAPPPANTILLAMSCGSFHGIIKDLQESTDGSLL